MPKYSQLPTAMLIESSQENASRIQELLAKASVKLVEWVKSGSGWMEVWQKTKPHMVIIDLQLPKRDGLFCVQKLSEFDPTLPIIFMHSYLGHLANEIELKALAVGASTVIQKPLVNSRFLVSVERILNTSKTIRALIQDENSGRKS